MCLLMTASHDRSSASTPTGSGDQSNPHTFDKLPADIIRCIFEISARAHEGMAGHLILVSRLTKVWIEPVLYEVVWLKTDRQAAEFINAVASKPTSFLERIEVLGLAYHVGRRLAAQILPMCPSLKGLACYVADLFSLPGILQLSTPRRLSLNTSSDPIRSRPDFRLPLFSNVTHLEFVDDTRVCERWTGFEFMPHLTHLAFNWSGRASSKLPPVHAVRALRTCPKLQVLVLVRPDFDGCPQTEGLERLKDHRAVILPQLSRMERNIRNEWEGQWFGERNIWQDAEEIVELQTNCLNNS